MTRGRLVDGHHSGHATATEQQWFDMCSEMADEGARRFAVTEANGPRARAGIRRFCKQRGYGIVQFSGAPGQGECAILHDRRVLRVRHRVPLLLTAETLTTTRQAPIWAPLACYEYVDTGATDWRTAAHLPAHLEGAGGFRRGWPTHVHRSAVTGWKRQLREAGVGDNVTLTFDANLNLRRPWVQAWAKARFPALRSAWRRPFPKVGTFKARVIDFALTGLHVVRRPRLIDPQPGMDHRGFVFAIRPPRNPKEHR